MAIDDVPLIVGSGVRLRGTVDSDVTERAALGRDRSIHRAFGEHLDADEALTDSAARTELARGFGPGPHWVIADNTDRFIGVIRLAPIDQTNRSARLAVGILDPTKLGLGLGTQAVELVLRHAFDDLDLHRVSLTVLAENERAIAVYRKCGFEVEGRLRDTLFRDGCWHDDLAMAILAPHWRKQRQR